LDVRSDAYRDHVLFDDVAKADACIDAIRGYVCEVVVSDDVYADMGWDARKRGRTGTTSEVTAWLP
jgi:hypothetical protein